MITLLDIKQNKQKKQAKSSVNNDIPSEQIRTLYASRYYEGSLTIQNLKKELEICKNVKSICFWSKLPQNLLATIKQFRQYNSYAFVTINPYDQSIEPNVPKKGSVVVPAFKELANKLGSDRTFWVYDPVFVSKQYNADTLCKNFDIIAKNLKSFTNYCLFDFASTFQRIALFLKGIKTRELSKEEKMFLEKNFVSIAKDYGINCYAIKDARFWNMIDVDVKNKRDVGKGVSCSLNCAYCYGYCGNNVRNIDNPTLLTDILEQ